MKLTKKWLEKKEACPEGIVWFEKQTETDVYKVLEKLIAGKHYIWANWLIVRVMEYKQYVSYAVYAAEQVIDIYEKQYSDDNRPRKAIEAAKICVNNPTKKNKQAARAAADAAEAARAAEAAWAADAADAARAAAWAAAWAADAAWAAAWAAADAAWAAAEAARAAEAAEAAEARAAARAAMQIKILNYGMNLLIEI